MVNLMIKGILVFIFLWFTMCALWHEMMHALEAARQGVTDGCIVPKFKVIKSIFVIPYGISFKYWGLPKNKSIISLAGGLYTAILCFLLVPLSSGHWRASFWILGWVQLVYGIYEFKYVSKWNTSKSLDKYDCGRYLLYAMVTMICISILKVF